jgi:Fur family ferric uptake transcriptional regulator
MKPAESPVADMKARIRAAGLKWTASRAAVLGVIEGSPKPLSHADVATTLERLGFDKATVYRNLMDLADAGLARRLELGDHTWRFESRTRTDDGVMHPHFVCTTCGGVQCLPESALRLTTRGTGLGNVREVLLKGDCAECV